MHHPTDRITHTTSCGGLAGTRNSSMGPPHEEAIRRSIAPWAKLHLAPMSVEIKKYMFYVNYALSTYHIYSSMALDIWRSTWWVETHCCHLMGYSYRLAVRIFYMHHLTASVTPFVEHWLEQDTTQWVHKVHRFSQIHLRTISLTFWLQARYLTQCQATSYIPLPETLLSLNHIFRLFGHMTNKKN